MGRRGATVGPCMRQAPLAALVWGKKPFGLGTTDGGGHRPRNRKHRGAYIFCHPIGGSARGQISSERRENPADQFCRTGGYVFHLQRPGQSAKWIVACHSVWQILNCILE